MALVEWRWDPTFVGARVLLVEDEADVALVVRNILEADGLKVRVAGTGAEALAALAQYDPQAVVLDVRLPDIDGFTLCHAIRRSSKVPILFLSARGRPDDRVAGLQAGADDYLVKPFHRGELVARVRALLRRAAMGRESVRASHLVAGPLALVPETRLVLVEGRSVHLTPLEFAILVALVEAGERVLTRQALLDLAWGENHIGDERTVDVHIRNLRRKLEEAKPGFSPVQTVRGLGYRLSS